MKRLMLAVMLLAAMASTAGAQVTRQVYDVPSEGQKQYLTIVGYERDPEFQALATGFENRPTLRALTNDTKFTALPAGSAMFAARYAKQFKKLPAVRLQTSNGDVIYEVAGDEIPDIATLEANLAEAHQQYCRAECFQRRAPSGPAEVKAPLFKAPVEAKASAPAPVKPTLWRNLKLVGIFCLAAAIGWCVGVVRVIVTEG